MINFGTSLPNIFNSEWLVYREGTLCTPFAWRLQECIIELMHEKRTNYPKPCYIHIFHAPRFNINDGQPNAKQHHVSSQWTTRRIYRTTSRGRKMSEWRTWCTFQHSYQSKRFHGCGITVYRLIVQQAWNVIVCLDHPKSWRCWLDSNAIVTLNKVTWDIYISRSTFGKC